MSNRTYKLGEISLMKYGTMPKKELINDTGYPIFSGYRITGYYPSFNCENEEIIVVARGVGGTGDVKIAPPKSFITNLSIIIKLNKEVVDKKFFFYNFKKNNLKYLDSGSAQSQITIDHLKRLSISLPSLEEQKRIADVLSCLDAKIENLRQQNNTLEQIAQTLFKHWFIDFEFPNTDGKPYKSSGGEMQSSVLGDIPAGWRVGKLGDVAKNIKKSIKKSDIKPNMSYIGLEHLPKKQIALDTWEQALDIASNKFWFNKGNILFGKLRPYFHKVGIAFTSGVCSTDILVIDSKEENYFSFILMVLSSEQFIDYVSLASEGTRMPRTSWEYMKDYHIVIPTSLILEDFNKLLKLFIKKMDVNIRQMQTLTKTRDGLLPKLISGQIRIEE